MQNTFVCSTVSPTKPSRAHQLLAALIVITAGLLLAASSRAQTDNFDDGDDAGWTRYDRTGTAIFSFPDGGYHIQGVYSGAAPLIFTTRSENYTNFYAAVDLAAWDDNKIVDARSALGLAFRASSIGFGTTKSLIAYWTPAISGGGNRVFSIYYIYNDQPFTAVAATIVTLEPTNTYRMVVTGTGDFIEGRIYDLKDLTRPVAYISGHIDPLNLPEVPSSGKCGLFLFSRNNTTVNVTFDNYVAAQSTPISLPAPATADPIPGTPQVVNRVPVSNKNFHPATNGISFTAATLGGNSIDPSGIHLFLNGSDVSSALVISGSGNSRSVNYPGLTSNQVYRARIMLAETGGKSSTNDFYFDTFSESFVTNTAKIVEAEDYNYSNGQFQNDPVPSGFDSSQTQVNGNGVGYVDLTGTPGVDFFDRRSGPESGFRAYRFFDNVGTFGGTQYYLTDGGATVVNTNDTPLQKFTSLDLPDYQVQHTEGGEWLNYTRQYISGKYYVYLRLSSVSSQEVLFDEVTGDRTLPGQTTSPIGKFLVGNTGHLSTYRYFPLVDDTGSPVILNWSGEKTFRLTIGGTQQDYTRYALQMNYLLFVPAPGTVTPFLLINPNRVGNTFSVSFASEAGVIYTLQYKNFLSDADWSSAAFVSGDGTIKMIMDNSSQSTRFYRVVGN